MKNGKKEGRPRKPTALKVLEGNPGKRPLNMNEPKPRPVIPDPPDWLEPDAKIEWAWLAPKLHSLGLFTEIDRDAFTAYCQAYSRWKAAEEFLTKHGTIFKAPSKELRTMPQVSVSRKYMQEMMGFMSRFGLTPSDRAGLAIEQAEDDSPMARILRGGQYVRPK